MRVDRQCLVQFLLSCTIHQFDHVLKTLNRDQLQIIIDIIYNVVQGICKVSDDDKTKLKKKKTLIREVLLPRLTLVQRKRKLFSIRKLLPIILKACHRHGSRIDINSKTEIRATDGGKDT